MQYHGRFNSFLIGIGDDPENEYQPKFKLVRIETFQESTHRNRSVSFLGAKRIYGPHFHWYNQFYGFFEDSHELFVFNSKQGYDIFIEKFSDRFNSKLLREAIPPSDFKILWNQIIEKKKELRIDGYITTSQKIDIDPKKLLIQILKREFF